MAQDLDPAVLERFSNAVTNLVSRFAAAAASLESVRLVDPAAFYIFTRAVKDTTGAVGLVLAPVLEKFAGLLKMLGDTILGLSPGTDKLIRGLMAAGIAMAAMAAGAAILEAVLTGGLSSIVTLIVGAAAGAAAMSGGFEKIKDVIGRVGDFVDDMVEKAMPAFDALSNLAGQAFSMLADAIGPVVSIFVSALVPVFQMLSKIFESLMSAVRPVVDILQGVATIAVAHLGVAFQVVGAVLQVFVNAIGLLFKALQDSGIIKVWLDMVQKIAGLVQAALGPILAAFTGTFTKLQGIMAGALQPVFNAIGTAMEKIMPIFLKVAQVVAGALGVAFELLAKAFDRVMTALAPIIDQLGGILAEVITELADIFAELVGGVADLLPSIVSLVAEFADLLVTLLTSEAVMFAMTMGLKLAVILIQLVADAFLFLARAVTQFIQHIVDLANFLRRKLGFSDIHLKMPEPQKFEPPARKPKPDSFGLTREAGTGNVEGMTQQFLLDVLKSSLAQKGPQERAADGIDDLNVKMDEMNKHLKPDDAEKNRRMNAAAEGKAMALGGVAGAGVAGAGGNGAAIKAFVRGVTSGFLGS